MTSQEASTKKPLWLLGTGFFVKWLLDYEPVEYKTHTRGQDNDLYYPKIGGRVASLVATVAHVKSLMDMSNQWSLSVTKQTINLLEHNSKKGIDYYDTIHDQKLKSLRYTRSITLRDNIV